MCLQTTVFLLISLLSSVFVRLENGVKLPKGFA